MHNIYFDNSATTAVLPEAAREALRVMTEAYGNPSSVHGMGVEAKKLLDGARATVLSSLGIRARGNYSLFFVSSGTEADNMAISGVIYSKKYRFTPRIITTDSEHPAVLNPIAEAEKRGFEVVRLSTVGGVIDMNELRDALTPNTVLVSVMRVNNETGAVYDVKSIFSLVKERCPEAVTHTDAVQGYMKVNCDPAKLGADLISISGHKIGAPKGIGALLCENSLITKRILNPIVFGGGQENGYRSGTENMAGIVAMAEAVRVKRASLEADIETVCAVRTAIIRDLPAGVKVNAPKGEYVPHVISLSAEGIKSEVLVRALSSEGICVSAGSACSSKKLKTSTALTAFGLSPDVADSTFRVSLSPSNTVEEAEIFCRVLKELVGRLTKKH